MKLFMIEFDYIDGPWFFTYAESQENALYHIYIQYPYLNKMKSFPVITEIELEEGILWSIYGDPRDPGK